VADGRGALVLALALAACGHAAPQTPAAAPPPPPLTAADLRGILDEVAAARQLAALREVRISLLDPPRFVGELRQRMGAERAAPSDAGFLLGFNLVPAPEQRKDISTTEQVLLEQVVGFYDKKLDIVLVRQEQPKDAAAAIVQRAVVAHEIHHALQAQHFTLPSYEGLGDDAALAAQALVEGDAMVAMAAYLGAHHGAPIRRTIRRVSDVIKAVPLEEVLGSDGQRLAHALPIARERLAFPYLDGMNFVTDLYRAGGFALVDRVYEHVPVSTSQILHPEKLVAGIAPAEVVVPAPAGEQVLLDERLGELQTRVVLSQCLPAKRAEAAAAGWAGDRYVVSTVGSELRMRWSTVWDSEAEADEFAQALGEAGACFGDNRENAGGGLRIAAGVASLKTGNRVVVARGVPETTAAFDAMLAAAPTQPPPAPLGNFVIPPRTPIPEPARGAVRGDLYRSDWLGIWGRIPPGHAFSVSRDGIELFLERHGQGLGLLLLSDRVAEGRYLEATFDESGQALANELGRQVQVGGGGTWRMALGEAIERTFLVPGTMLQVRTLLVPICNHTGSLVFMQAYADPAGRAALDAWLYSFRFIGPGRAPVCDWLDPP
jgi:hypothetical protein